MQRELQWQGTTRGMLLKEARLMSVKLVFSFFSFSSFRINTPQRICRHLQCISAIVIVNPIACIVIHTIYSINKQIYNVNLGPITMAIANAPSGRGGGGLGKRSSAVRLMAANSPLPEKLPLAFVCFPGASTHRAQVPTTRGLSQIKRI